MGWFDDNFGDSDIEFEGDLRCKGITLAGKRCRVSADSPYPTARTILSKGYCTKHLSQSQSGGGSSLDRSFTTRHGVYSHDKPHPPIVTAARNGNLESMRQMLQSTLPNDALADGLCLGVVEAHRKRLEVEEKMGYDKEWTWDDDTALIAASREGHDEIVLELVCAGADPTAKSCPSDDVHETALQAVEKGWLLVQERISSRLLSKGPARTALERRGRMARIQILLAAALDAWPLPKSPAAITSVNVRPATELTVEELKAVLRHHKAKVSGKKAELIDRVAAGGYLELDCAEELSKQQQVLHDFSQKRQQFRDAIAQRSGHLRAVFVGCAPGAPTEAEVSAAAALHEQAHPQGMKRVLCGEMPPSKYSRISRQHIPTPMMALASNRPAQFPAQASSSKPRCGCGRDFVSVASMTDHQANSSKCPYSRKYRR